MIPFGKDMLNFLWEWSNSDSQLQQQRHAQADAFFKKYNIKVSFARGPAKKTNSWHIKATETFQWFANFREFCASISYDLEEPMELVEEFLLWMKIAYKWEFKTEEDFQQLTMYKEQFPLFVDQ